MPDARKNLHFGYIHIYILKNWKFFRESGISWSETIQLELQLEGRHMHFLQKFSVPSHLWFVWKCLILPYTRHHFSFALCAVRYCVCYIHEEVFRLLNVLQKESMLAHENCQCNCDFCAEGFCKCIFNDDMDFYWYMRHLLCVPTKLHSMTSRNVFKPRYMILVYILHA